MMPPVVDWERLRLLCGNDAKAANELLQMALDDARQTVTAARTAIDADNAAALRELAHGLRGAALNVGALRLADAAGELSGARLESLELAIVELESEVSASSDPAT